MPQRINTEGVPLLSWAAPEDLDTPTITQLSRLARLPCVAHHIAIMPDVHLGAIATVGTVVPMRQAIAPALLGVDLGCGMMAARVHLKAEELPDSLRELRLCLEASVPLHLGPPKRDAALSIESGPLLARVQDLEAGGGRLLSRAELQLGTLGGGNHFLELHLDGEGFVWLVLHTGSRGLGAAVAEFHMERAERMVRKHGGRDPELAVLLSHTEEFRSYRRDLAMAQDYAEHNRRVILERALDAIFDQFGRRQVDAAISCVHNFVAEEVHYGEELLVTRKGAISAPEGVLGIIPGSMGSSTFVVRGQGTSESFCSASHGAGRRLSRKAARRAYSLRDFERQTLGVECRKDSGLIDEAPKAYKNIERVMQRQNDLVAIEHELRPILSIKG